MLALTLSFRTAVDIPCAWLGAATLKAKRDTPNGALLESGGHRY